MTTRTITFRVCDGCGKSELDGVEIAESKNKYEYHDTPTIDICTDCVEKDRYICRLCKCVHDDEHPCEQQLIIIEEMKRPKQYESFPDFPLPL